MLQDIAKGMRMLWSNQGKRTDQFEHVDFMNQKKVMNQMHTAFLKTATDVSSSAVPVGRHRGIRSAKST